MHHTNCLCTTVGVHVGWRLRPRLPRVHGMLDEMLCMSLSSYPHECIAAQSCSCCGMGLCRDVRTDMIVPVTRGGGAYYYVIEFLPLPKHWTMLFPQNKTLFAPLVSCVHCSRSLSSADRW